MPRTDVATPDLFLDRSPDDSPRDVPTDGPAPDGADVRNDVPICVPMPELCDGVDNDCDPSTVDGSDEPAVGTLCDGSDGDSCDDGAITCNGTLLCDDDANSRVEMCNEVDDDCDIAIDEDVADRDYFRDADGDGYGDPMVRMSRCAQPFGYVSSSTDCDDSNAMANPDATETCNGIDDDCDGYRDEGAGDPMASTVCGACVRRVRGASTYHFCENQVLNWSSARAACMATGYDLVVINNSGEQSFLWTTAQGIQDDDWWTGLAEGVGEDGEFYWVTGEQVWTGGQGGGPYMGAYHSFGPTQPDGAMGTRNCALFDSSDAGLWHDRACSGTTARVICEVN